MWEIGTRVEAVESQVEYIRNKRVMDTKSFYYGTVDPAEEFEISAELATTIGLYCHEGSIFYRDPQLLDDIYLQLDFLARQQFDDGSISLITCNIQSPPDTAFMVNVVALCYQLLDRKQFREMEMVQQSLRNVLERTIPCLVNGGFHTPNHRWVISCSLAMLYEIFGRDELRDQAFQYLGEGLDVSKSGEWTERSNSIYNAICDLSLYHVGRVFGVEAAFEAIRRNLDAMRYMLHPGNSIATEFSRRQDRGQVAYMNYLYYIIYTLMASLDNNSDYKEMADTAFQTMGNDGVHEALIYSLVYPSEFAVDLPSGTIPERYTKVFGDSHDGSIARVKQNYKSTLSMYKLYGVVRHRNEDLSVSILSGQPDFLYMQFGSARLVGVKLVLGYFGLAAVPFTSLNQIDTNKYALEIEIEGCYFGVLDSDLTKGKDGVYELLPNHKRNVTNSVLLKTSVVVTILEDGIELTVDIGELPNIFAQLVWMFDPRGELSGEGLVKIDADITRLERGCARYRCDGYTIEIGEGVIEHNFVKLRNDVVNRETVNLQVNMTTPVHRHFKVKCLSEQ